MTMPGAISLTESSTLPVISCGRRKRNPKPLLGCILLIVGLGVQFSHVFAGWLGSWLGLGIAAVGLDYLSTFEHHIFFEFDPVNKKASYSSRVVVAKRFNIDFYRPKKFSFTDVQSIMVRLATEKRSAQVSLRLADMDLIIREYDVKDANAEAAASNFAKELHGLLGSPIIEHRRRSNNLGLAVD